MPRIDFSQAKPPQDWPHGDGRYQELRRIWLWKQEWGYDDHAMIGAGRGLASNKPSLDTRRTQEAPAVMSATAAKPNAATAAVTKGETQATPTVAEARRGMPPRQPTAKPYDPASAPLVTALDSTLRNRWAIERTAARDQITEPYSTARRAELVSLCGRHPLALEYGLRTTANMAKTEDQAGVRVVHDQSSIYLRDATGVGAEVVLEDLFRKKFTGEAAALSAAQGTTKNKPPNKRGTAEPQKTAAQFFVNTPNDEIKKRLATFHGADWGGILVNGRTATVREISDGVHVMTFVPPLSYETRYSVKDGRGNPAGGNESDAGWFLHGALQPLGATPSSYDAIRSLSRDDLGTKPPEALKDPRLRGDTDAKCDETIKGLKDNQGAKTLKALPADHPMKVVATAAVNMVTGLEKTLETTMTGSKDDLNHNKLVANALASLQRLLAAAPAYLEDTPRFTKMFDLMVDEVYLVLGTCKPYNPASYETIAQDELKRRAPVLAEDPVVPMKSVMVTSGMDSLATAVEAAIAATGSGEVTLLDAQAAVTEGGPKPDRSANYFQIQMELLHTEELIRGDGRVIVGTLNPSSPTKTFETGDAGEWGVDELIKSIQARIDTLNKGALKVTRAAPVCAIVDVTVEKATEKAADQELNTLFAAFKTMISAEEMTITLCKSYQKYPSLGSGKIMLGGVTVVGRNDALTKSVEDAAGARNALDKDEAQLMSHFVAMTEPAAGDVTHFDAERQMLERSASNASVLRKMMADPDNPADFEYAEGLPFLLYATGGLEFETEPDSGGRGTDKATGKKVIQPQHLMTEVGVEGRFSFGFQNSSCLKIPGGVRITAGNEPEEEMVEKFYVIAQLAKAPPAADLKSEKSATRTAAAKAVADKAAWAASDIRNAGTAAVDKMLDDNNGNLKRGTNSATVQSAMRKAMNDAISAGSGRSPNFPSEVAAKAALKTGADNAARELRKCLHNPTADQSVKKLGDTSAREAGLACWSVADVQTMARGELRAAITRMQDHIAAGETVETLTLDAETASNADVMTRSRGAAGFASQGSARAAAEAAASVGMAAVAQKLKTGVAIDDLKALSAKAISTAANEALQTLPAAPPDKAKVEDDPPYDKKAITWANKSRELLIAAGMLDCLPEGMKKAQLTAVPKPDEVKGIKALIANLRDGVAPAGKDDMDIGLAQLKAAQAALRPMADSDAVREGDDIALMRAGMTRGYRDHPEVEPSFEAKNLPNILASCALVGAAVFDNDQNRKDAMELIDQLVETRMEGVSTESREKLVTARVGMDIAETKDWGAVSAVDLKKKGAAVKKVLDLAPYREAAAGLFLNEVPEAAFSDTVEEGLSDARDGFAGVFLDRLDMSTACTLLETLVAGEQKKPGSAKQRAKACDKHLNASIQSEMAAFIVPKDTGASLPEPKKQPKRDPLSHEPPKLAGETLDSDGLKAGKGPKAISYDELENLEKRRSEAIAKI